MYADTNIAPAVWSHPLKDRLGSYLAALRTYRRTRRDLLRLSEMSDHTLGDIGLTRDEVRCLKPASFRHFDR
jgi:uncharacterized protein YjiS (DUF1127 family)